MEYWDGWFNRWGEPVIQREGTDLAKEVKDMLAVGSFKSLYVSWRNKFRLYNGVRREVQKIYLKSLAMIMMLY